jgi:gluconokinase
MPSKGADVQRQGEPIRISSPRAIIVMGVSGSGKSTLGAALAAKLDCPFLEGDAFHDPDSIAKMRGGRPLADSDRWPWLDRLGAAAREAIASHGLAVVACSALKRAYRERLASAIGAPSSFVLLDADPEVLAGRVSNRPNHYMPESLLVSQLTTLERPAQDEPAITLNAEATVDELCERSLEWLGAGTAPTK